MASEISSVEVAKDTLYEQGFLTWDDSTVGDGLQEMDERDALFTSEYFLDFFNQQALNTHILSIVKSFFGDATCVLAHCLKYIEYPGHILCFRKGGPEAGRRVLALHLAPKGSQLGYYGGSHRYLLTTTEGQRFTYEIAPSAMDKVGSKCMEKKFINGGLSIFDARIGFEIQKGYVILLEFVTIDVLALGNWQQMILPPELVQKVADIKRDLVNRNFTKIELNFVFRECIPLA